MSSVSFSVVSVCLSLVLTSPSSILVCSCWKAVGETGIVCFFFDLLAGLDIIIFPDVPDCGTNCWTRGFRGTVDGMGGDEDIVDGVSDGVVAYIKDGIEEEGTRDGETEKDRLGTGEETAEGADDGVEAHIVDGIEEEDQRDGWTEKDDVAVPIVVARSVEGRGDCTAVGQLNVDGADPVGAVRVGGQILAEEAIGFEYSGMEALPILLTAIRRGLGEESGEELSSIRRGVVIWSGLGRLARE